MARQVSFSAGQPMTLGNALAQRSPLFAYGRDVLASGTDASPLTGGWMEGVSRLGRALAGGHFMNQGRERDREERRQTGLTLAQALAGGAATPEALASLLANPDTQGVGLALAQRNQPAAPPAGFERAPDGSLRHIRGGPHDPDYLRIARAAGQDPWVAVGDTILPRAGLQRTFGDSPAPAGGPQSVPASPTAPGGQVPPGVLPQLRAGESGGDPNAISSQGAQGLYQFTPATWSATLRNHPELAQRWGNQDITNPAAQEEMAQAFAQDIMRANGDLVGRVVNGVPVTPEGLVRGGWLGGIAGVRRYVETNGQYDPEDANGTRVSQYVAGTARNLRPLQVAQAGAPPAGVAARSPTAPAVPTGAAPGGPQPTMTRVGDMPAMVLPRSPQAQVNIDQRRDNALIQLDADRIKSMQEQTGTARNMINLLDRAERAIRAVPEGAGAQFLPAFGQAARALGIDIPGTSDSEVLRAIQNTLAGLQRIPGSGATSDYEMRLYMQAVPQLGNTREGNLQLVDMGRRLLRRRMEEMRLARTVMRRDGNLDHYDDEVDGLGPVFNEQDIRVLSGGGAGPAQSGPGQPGQVLRFDRSGNPIQ